MGAVDAATSDTSGVVEVDLVFPRNDTYAPGPYVPIVFAVQNPKLAALLELEIDFQVLNATNGSIVDQGSFGDYWKTEDFNSTNTSSSSPELLYRHYEKLNTEGKWILLWTVYWRNCTDGSRERETDLNYNTQNLPIIFTTKKSAQEIDLVDVTKDDNCSLNQGMAFNITGTKEVTGPPDIGEQCAVLGNTTVTPTPCAVKIDSTAASSMSAALTASLCSDQYQMLVEAGRIPEPQVSCPTDESAAQQLLVGGMTCLMVGIGALSYLLL
jgi:hypothetical protein